MTFYNWVTSRENGLRPKIGDEDFILKLIYKSLKPWRHWNEDASSVTNPSKFGAVFNLEFSPDGNILVAACEKKSIVLYDSTTTKQTKAIVNAHTDNVNCVKFLDNRTFATCSDDTTVALWDVRNLKNKIRSLHGHSNWVKNIEYSHSDNLLVTSGFDGSVYTWDISSYTEQGFIYQKVFHTSGLMRCRLTPDAKKLIICTTGGYLIIIHDLNLTTLAKDLNGFKPNIYRLMQLGRQFIPNAAKFDNMFSKEQKRNRVELISDFPAKNDAEIVCALQIHPQGWCCLSRNISYDQSSEWTCLHDIQEYTAEEREIYKDESYFPGRKRKLSETERCTAPNNSCERPPPTSTSNNITEIRAPPLLAMASASITRNNPSENRSSNGAIRNISVNGINRAETYVPDIWAAEVTVHDRAYRTAIGVRNSGAHAYAYIYPISSGVIPLSRSTAELNLFDRTNMRVSLSSRTPSNNDDDDLDDDDDDDEDDEEDSEEINLAYDNFQFLHGSSSSRNNSNENNSENTSPLISSNTLMASSFNLLNSNSNNKIYINHKRLMYYIEEPTKGQGFIKEQAFSSDGRIICSPYENGVRLLAFNDECSDLPTAVTCSAYERPQQLKEINRISSHKDIVVSSKFNPKYPLLVTGCLSGSITWHQSDF